MVAGSSMTIEETEDLESFMKRIEEEIDQIRLEYTTPIIIVSDVNMKLDPKDLEKKFRKFIGY